jgi:hypothetical protein
MGLERRFYIPISEHKGMRFDIYTDGLVIMYVFGVEVARKKLRSTLDPDIYREFAAEMSVHMGVAPTKETTERLEALERDVGELKKKVK